MVRMSKNYVMDNICIVLLNHYKQMLADLMKNGSREAMEAIEIHRILIWNATILKGFLNPSFYILLKSRNLKPKFSFQTKEAGFKRIQFKEAVTMYIQEILKLNRSIVTYRAVLEVSDAHDRKLKYALIYNKVNYLKSLELIRAKPFPFVEFYQV